MTSRRSHTVGAGSGARERAAGEADDSLASASGADSVLLEIVQELAPERSVAAWDPSALAGELRFQIGSQLGKGGVGMVFRAHDTVLGRDVALKLLRERDPVTIARFVHEARAQARVEHANVCKVYDVGELAGAPFIAMQLIDGETLDRAGADLALAQRARIMKHVADGVHAAHRIGLIHRDLKPQNILVERTARGELWPYVVDFGLAREADAGNGLTLTGQALGTPPYMAPEQVRGEPLDRRADVYALGATLYHLLVGRPPFSGATPADVLARVLGAEPEPARRKDPRIPADLDAITMRCLEKQPQDRYASAHELAQDLQRYLDGEPVHARRIGALARCKRVIRRHPRASAIAATGALALVVVMAGLHLVTHRALDARVSHLLAEARAVIVRADGDAVRADAHRADAAGAFSAGDRGAGEASWSAAIAVDARVDRSYRDAGQTLEAAIAVDPERGDLRALFGDLLVRRALRAERDRRPTERDDLIRSLALYDPGGERLRSWRRPGHLVLAVTPPGVSTTIERYVEDPRDHLQLEPAHPAAQSRAAEIDLSPGSYLLTCSGAGLATVRYPVVLRRGESVRVAFAVPPASAIPEDFVYIPPGRFLFGTSADDISRSMLGATPLHEARTDGYLIGRHEVTVAEFIAFLHTLPPARRALSSERSSSRMMTALRELAPADWQYRFELAASHGVGARTGEKLRYAGRRSHAVQDWTRFPILGLSAADAEAYVAWLARDRVPGARLCSEKEWERAARGADDREYPHGRRLYLDDANYADTYADKIDIGPDEVGLHPASRSPFGLDDLVGNAGEYTRSSLAGDRYVMRGGSFSYNANQNRVTARSGITASYRGPAHGLRVCAPAPVR